MRGHFHVSPVLPNCDLTAAFAAAEGAPCLVVWLTDRPGFALYHPGAIFAPNTKYNFTLDSGVSATDGTVNSLDHHWDLTSARAPTVVSETPTDGASEVAIDAPLVVQFDRAMSSAATAGAITLSPQGGALTVVRNTVDDRRFVAFPGTLLRAHTAYALMIGGAARDQGGQPLGGATVIHFVTGGLSGARHTAVMVSHGGAPTAVVLTALAPAQAGEPVATATVLDVGSGPGGIAGVGLASAALGPGGLLAVVETGADGSSLLRVLDIANDEDIADVSGATLPAWSSRGDLAYSSGGQVVVRQLSGDLVTLPSGDPLVDAPIWSSDGRHLVLPVAAAGQPPHIDLASPQLRARYALPQVTGTASNPAISADGALLVLRRDGPTVAAIDGTWLVGLGGRPAQPVLLDSAATPLGFSNATTIILARRPVDGSASLARIGTDGSPATVLPGGPAASDLASSVVSSDGRQISYLAAAESGGTQVWIENSDGSGVLALTSLGSGDSAVSISFSP